MALFRCLSPSADSLKERDLRSELQQAKAQLAEAKITIADLKQGAALRDSGEHDRIGTAVAAAPAAPTKTSVGVQAKPLYESRIPRPDETGAVKFSAPGSLGAAAAAATGLRVSMTDASTEAGCGIGSSNSTPQSPSAGGIAGAAAIGRSPSRNARAPLPKSRIPASPSPDLLAVRRTQSAKHSSTPGAPAASSEQDNNNSNQQQDDNQQQQQPTPHPTRSSGGDSSHCSSDGGAAAASSSLARAEFLQNRLKVEEAFRLSLESELQELRFRNAGLQTQVLTLQTKLERSVEAQVDELSAIERLRKGAAAAAVGSGGSGSSANAGDSSRVGPYEEALAELAAMSKKLEASEANRTVAEQQARHATDLAASRHEQLCATQAELSGLKSELAAAQARLMELAAEGARLKQANNKLSKAHGRVGELEAALAAARAEVVECKERISKLEEETANQKAIIESNGEELLALSTAHGQLKQAYFKMEAESQQHDQLVQIVQQELQEMSYYAAAGRVALGLAKSDDVPMVSGAVLVTPRLPNNLQTAVPASAIGLQPSSCDGGAGGGNSSSSNGSSTARNNKQLVEETAAVCIAAAAAAGAAAAIAATPVSPRTGMAAAVVSDTTTADAAAAAHTAAGEAAEAESPEPSAAELAAAEPTAMTTTLAAAKAAEAACMEACGGSEGTQQCDEMPADIADATQ